MAVSTPRLTPKSQSKQIRRNSYLKFNQLLLTTIFTILSAVVGINWLVDPYGIFKTPKIQGFNQDKPQRADNDRLFKTADIIHVRPKTILLGSSRMRQGIDPDSSSLKKNTTSPIYNLGLNGSNIYELRKYLEHTLVNNPDLKQVVIGIDFFMFNENQELQAAFDKERLEKTYIIPKDLLNTLLSLTAVSDSKETLRSSWKSRQKTQDLNQQDNGFSPYKNPKLKDQEWRFKNAVSVYFNFHHDYELSPELIGEFEKIVNICQENNIDLKVFISPSHGIQWESIAATQRWDSFEKWKREMVKLHPVWDFSGYNSITTETLSQDNLMKNYTDSSHYTPKVGNLVLNRIFEENQSTIPDDFGILLTQDNIEQQLSQIRSDRKIWQENHPQEVQLVKDIKQKFDRQKR
ncbi:MAG: hypothetical protein AB4041_07675 [Microcystaceae cyanobacterium]